MKEKHECRICLHYKYERDVEVDQFSCIKGYFYFSQDDEGFHGNLPNEGGVGSNDMPCKGKDFLLNKFSKWYKSTPKN